MSSTTTTKRTTRKKTLEHTFPLIRLVCFSVFSRRSCSTIAIRQKNRRLPLSLLLLRFSSFLEFRFSSLAFLLFLSPLTFAAPVRRFPLRSPRVVWVTYRSAKREGITRVSQAMWSPSEALAATRPVCDNIYTGAACTRPSLRPCTRSRDSRSPPRFRHWDG